MASTADASVDDVDRAVMSGWRAFLARSWAGRLPAERERILLRFADLVEQHGEELAQLETPGRGNPLTSPRLRGGMHPELDALRGRADHQNCR
ncbi:aldehyde dehydrogenase family protein [Enterobacter hormaechei]